MNTARSDYPMMALKDVHMFEYFMSGLRAQTFTDFEVIICDVLFDERHDYFEKHPESFHVKHVPIKPNIWTPRGYTAISTTKNTCLLYAEGQIVVFTDDCSTFKEDHLKNILETLTPEIGVSNKILCYRGDNITYKDLRPSGDTYNVWGNVALYLKTFLDVNGYNEQFDGSKGLEDCDFSYRVHNSGIKWHLLDYPVLYQSHATNKNPFISLPNALGPRCCRLAEVVSQARKDPRANSVPLTDEELAVYTKCNENEEGHICEILHSKCRWNIVATEEDKANVKLYQHPSLIFDLKEQRRNIYESILELERLIND